MLFYSYFKTLVGKEVGKAVYSISAVSPASLLLVGRRLLNNTRLAGGLCCLSALQNRLLTCTYRGLYAPR